MIKAKVLLNLIRIMVITNIDIMEDNSAFMELNSMFNEAWTNGYIDGYISVIRKEPEYCEHREEYEGRMLEEYECGYLSAIHDDVKWTRKYALSRGYIDGYKASQLEWTDFGYFAFWMSEYTGELQERYNVGYSEGFFAGYSKQKDFEWALGFVNQLRNPHNQLCSKNYHDDHGKLFYPIAYEEGYEAAKTFCKYDSLDKAQKSIHFSLKTLWIIGFIDGMHNRNKRFDINPFNKNLNKKKTIFDESSYEYDDGYEAGQFTCLNQDMEMVELESNSINKEYIASFRKQRNEERIWETGYIDGRTYGTLRYRGYDDDEYDIYKIGYDIGCSELKKDRLDEENAVSLFSAQHTGEIDAKKYDYMIYHGYDRPRFHAYREGFYKEKEYKLKEGANWNKTEGDDTILFHYLKSIHIPHACKYIKNKLEAWKLGVKSGFTGNSASPNKNIFFFNEKECSSFLNDDYSAHNIESDLYESYKDGCKFGYEHTYMFRWDYAHDNGFADGYDYVSANTSDKRDSRNKYKGFELEAYEKGWTEGCEAADKENRQPDDCSEDSAYEWTMEDTWDAMTDGMYGDYRGDVDFDKSGF